MEGASGGISSGSGALPSVHVSITSHETLIGLGSGEFRGQLRAAGSSTHSSGHFCVEFYSDWGGLFRIMFGNRNVHKIEVRSIASACFCPHAVLRCKKKKISL